MKYFWDDEMEIIIREDRLFGFPFFFGRKLTTAIAPMEKIVVTPRKEFTRERYRA